jgi:hypothetical protein
MDYSGNETPDKRSARLSKSTRNLFSGGFAREELPPIRRSNSNPDLQKKTKKPSSRRRGSVGMTSAAPSEAPKRRGSVGMTSEAPTEAPKRRGSLGISFGSKRPSMPRSNSSRRGSFFGNMKSGKKKKDDMASQVMAALDDFED